MASHGGEPVLTAYASSKGALATLTRNAGYSLQPDRIRVNGLNIGWTATEGEHGVQTTEGQPDDWLAEADASAALGRLLRPHDIAPMVTYLLSDAARDGHGIGHRLRSDGARARRHARGARRGERVRIYLTGASGFVGSNLVRVFEAHGAEIVRPGHGEVDITDGALVRRSVAATEPDAIVHAAIWNNVAGLLSDRRRAWGLYVEATRNLVDAANATGARIVLISTDWVFDGTQGPATEDEPPNPIDPYGFLKAASELVVTERAQRGTVARIAGVQGMHWARPEAPRAQDAGFGYFVGVAGAMRCAPGGASRSGTTRG